MTELMSTDVMPAIPMGGTAVQRVQTPFTTAMAVQAPRNITAIEKRAVQEAALLGDRGFYAWGAGKNHVEGPSQELAYMLSRVWGNCAHIQGPMQETHDAWVFEASFVDLETGFTTTRLFRQSKRWTVYGQMDEDRKADIRFEIGQSKAIRNVSLKALPAWLVDRAMDECKGNVRAKIEASIDEHGIEWVQKAYLARLTKFGAPESRVLECFGRAAPTALTLEDLVTLAGNIRALETKSDTIDAMFPVAETSETKKGVAGVKERMRRKPAEEAPPADEQPPDEAPEPDPDIIGPAESVVDKAALVEQVKAAAKALKLPEYDANKVRALLKQHAITVGPSEIIDRCDKWDVPDLQTCLEACAKVQHAMVK